MRVSSVSWASIVLEPADVNGTGFLQVWAYDQRQLPGFYSYQPTTKRVRSYPVDQRFEPLFPGNTYFVTEYYMAGDPLLTWGNFKLVGKGPLLAGASSLRRPRPAQLATQDLRWQERCKVLAHADGTRA